MKLNLYNRKSKNFWLISIIAHLALVLALFYYVKPYIYQSNTELISADLVKPLRFEANKTEADTPRPQVEKVSLEFQAAPELKVEVASKLNSVRSAATGSRLLRSASSGLSSEVWKVDKLPGASSAAASSPIRGSAVEGRTVALAQASVESQLSPASSLDTSAAVLGAGGSDKAVRGAASFGRSSGFGSGQEGRGRGSAQGGRSKLGMSGLIALDRSEGSGEVLSDVASNVSLGGEIPPLPKGEPGGIIIGKGKDIKGRLHLVRIDDPTDPAFDVCGSGARAISFCAGVPYLIKHLNETTGIKASIEGAIRLTDSALFKAPIIFMEPIIVLADKHTSRAVQSLASLQPLWMTQGLRNKYSQSELANLRQYLVERGGFMYVLAHGNSEQTLRGIRNLLAEVLPEHNLQRIPNDHEIYSSYYELGGPLRFPVRNLSPFSVSVPLIAGQFSELLGVFVNDRLAVVVDTEASMHILDIAMRKSFYGRLAPNNDTMVELAPNAARELTNVIIYAMTHGKISNYGDYVPETSSDPEQLKVPKSLPASLQGIK